MTKKLIVFLELIIVFFIIFNVCYPKFVFAEYTDNDLVRDMGSAKEGITENNAATNWGATILAAVQISATGMSLIALSWAGIKYFTASAATAKAKCKGQLYYSFLGAVIAFGATTFVRIIWDEVNS